MPVTRFSNQQLTFILLLIVAMWGFSACDDETVDDLSNCEVRLIDFEVDDVSFSAGSSITGSVTLAENMGLDVLTLRSLTQIFLSTNSSYSADDLQLTAFSGSINQSGNQSTIPYNQIDIPFNVSSGSYYLIARTIPTACSGGLETQSQHENIAVTIQ